jgi:hypothetical protein
MTSHEQIPSFLAEMPEPALASYLNPGIGSKAAPERATQPRPKPKNFSGGVTRTPLSQN